MDKAFAWIEQIMEFLLSLFPHLITVNTNQKAVKQPRGTSVKILGPGLHWYWPLVTEEPEVVSTVRDSSTFTTQKLTTQDGKRVAITLAIVFRIADPEKAIIRTTDLDSQMSDVLGAAASAAVAASPWDTLRSTPAELAEGLMGPVQDEMADYGVIVENIRVKDLTETLAICLMGDGFLTGAADADG